MQVNDLGFVASILFVLVPTVFLLILYIKLLAATVKDS
jgi:photosystem II PsbM protein